MSDESERLGKREHFTLLSEDTPIKLLIWNRLHFVDRVTVAGGFLVPMNTPFLPP